MLIGQTYTVWCPRCHQVWASRETSFLILKVSQVLIHIPYHTPELVYALSKRSPSRCTSSITQCDHISKRCQEQTMCARTTQNSQACKRGHSVTLSAWMGYIMTSSTWTGSYQPRISRYERGHSVPRPYGRGTLWPGPYGRGHTNHGYHGMNGVIVWPCPHGRWGWATTQWSGEKTNDLFPLCPVRRVPGPASKLIIVSSVPGPASARSGEQTNDLFPLCPVRRVPGPASKLMIVSSVPGPANKLMI